MLSVLSEVDESTGHALDMILLHHLWAEPVCHMRMA